MRGNAGGARRLEIVQLVRRMGPGGGVGGVAWALQPILAARGVAGAPITVTSLSPAARPPRTRWDRAWEVVAFSWKASLAARAARRRGAVVVVHGDALGGDIYVDHGRHRRMVARRPWLLLNPLHLFILAREAVRDLDRRVRRAALSAADAGEEAGRHGQPVAVLSNGVDLQRFSPDPLRLEEPASAAGFVLAFVGHEFGRKGLMHVVRALPHLPEGVRLKAAGGRPAERRRAAGLARWLGVAERVELLGVVADVAPLLRDSDLLVLPSAAEAFPLVALEAMASGVPALLSNTPAARELFGPEGRGGWTASPDAAAIAAVVRRLLADAEGYPAHRRAARARAERFGWEAAADRYVELAHAVQRERAASGGPCAS